MESARKILFKNNWITEKEFENLLANKKILRCINECTSPNKTLIFNALKDLEPQNVKVIIIGQDPYPDKAQKAFADGMAFSCKSNKYCPASLKRIFTEIKKEYNTEEFKSCSLINWKKQGVLLLNSALTYSPNMKINERIKIWKPFVTKIIEKVINSKKTMVVMLWGKIAQDTFNGISFNNHTLILKSSHPQARKKYNTFNNSNLFRICNDFLKEQNEKQIQWWKT